MSNEEGKAYFKHSVVRYSMTDVQELLKAKLSCAGPLLEVVVNGIDNVGGICYGFSSESGSRSEQFMTKKMSISTALAKFLYSIVRCGVAHQGMPKIGVIYFVEYEYPQKEKIFYMDSDNNIWLNVVSLALRYLDAINAINEDIENNALNFPILQPKENAIFNQAKVEINDIINELAFNVGTQRMDKEHPGASCSAYSAVGTLKVSIDSPHDPHR